MLPMISPSSCTAMGPDDRLIGLFGTFPFRAVEVDGGTYKLNAEEFNAELQKLRNAA
jgi:hypothetical protein